MKNIIKVINLKDNIEFKSNLSLEEYGFIYYLKLNKPEIDLSNLFKDLLIDLDKFKSLAEQLSEKKVIQINIKTSEYINVIWEFIFLEKKEKTLEIKANKNYEKIFILNDDQRDSLRQINDSKELFMRLFKIYQDTYSKYELNEYLTINNEEDYKNYLKKLSPISIFLNNQIVPQIKEVNLIFTLVHEKDINVEVINFLIDYVVSTSIFNNFSNEYFLKILGNWQKNDINTLEKAMEFVKNKKQETKKSNYKEPEWEKLENQNVENDLEEIEKLLKKMD